MPFTALTGNGDSEATQILQEAATPLRFNLDLICEDFSQKVRNAGLDYGSKHEELIRMFVVSLATKGFVLFTGLSGAGKTRLAMAIGEWFGSRRLHVEAVRPDWTSPDALLGCENLLSESTDARYAWNVPRTLEFILTAERDPANPYLLLLEEMNLARVEQYFADVLSGMESNHPVVPNLHIESGLWRMPNGGQRYISWPRNLFVVGTVNTDETTYTFSPKVLDRANTIEFRVPPGSLRDDLVAPKSIERGRPDFVRAFLARSRGADPTWDERELFADRLRSLHRTLFDHDFEFGHRIFIESLRYASLMANAGEKDYRVTLDQVMMQKILPKFQGSVSELGDAMAAVATFAFYEEPREPVIDALNPPPGVPALPASFAKLQRMARRLKNSNVVRFSE